MGKKEHATREEFDAWLDKQCMTAKNKSLWKRTRRREEPQEKKGPPELTKEKARELLTKALDTFRVPANKEKLEGIVKECEGADPAQAGMMKMLKLLPAVQEMVGGLLPEYGYGAGDLMAVTAKIQSFAPEDESIAADCAKLMKAVSGDFSGVHAG